MSTGNHAGGKGLPARKAVNLTAIYEMTLYKMWKFRPPTLLWAFMVCYRDSFTFVPLMVFTAVLLARVFSGTTAEDEVPINIINTSTAVLLFVAKMSKTWIQ
jgi:hypothetical protein